MAKKKSGKKSKSWKKTRRRRKLLKEQGHPLGQNGAKSG